MFMKSGSALCFLCSLFFKDAAKGVDSSNLIFDIHKTWIGSDVFNNNVGFNKLAAGDMIAIEAKYHHDCLRS